MVDNKIDVIEELDEISKRLNKLFTGKCMTIKQKLAISECMSIIGKVRTGEI